MSQLFRAPIWQVGELKKLEVALAEARSEASKAEETLEELAALRAFLDGLTPAHHFQVAFWRMQALLGFSMAGIAHMVVAGLPSRWIVMSAKQNGRARNCRRMGSAGHLSAFTV